MERAEGKGTSPEDVLSFWFGPPSTPPLASAGKWYKKDDAFDREILDRFADARARAARGELEAWKATPRGRVALVILLDQMSRNMYRGDPNAFDQDARACAAAVEGIEAGIEGVLDVMDRFFLYMPLMHAEDVDLQHKCVAAFERLLRVAPEPLRDFVASGLDYAKKHAEVVEQFGRFPHRNEILGRTSTGEEIEFLRQAHAFF
jgi:uncharacterized protein (DUF924 family)